MADFLPRLVFTLGRAGFVSLLNNEKLKNVKNYWKTKQEKLSFGTIVLMLSSISYKSTR